MLRVLSDGGYRRRRGRPPEQRGFGFFSECEQVHSKVGKETGNLLLRCHDWMARDASCAKSIVTSNVGLADMSKLPRKFESLMGRIWRMNCCNGCLRV